jgi:hypothetical protein
MLFFTVNSFVEVDSGPGLLDGYLVGEMTNVKNEQEVAVNMSLLLKVSVMEISLAIVRFAVGKSCMGENECDFRMVCY